MQHNKVDMEYWGLNFDANHKPIGESVLMRWMSLESIKQSEVNHKEEDKYCVLIYIFGI